MIASLASRRFFITQGIGISTASYTRLTTFSMVSDDVRLGAGLLQKLLPKIFEVPLFRFAAVDFIVVRIDQQRCS